MADAELVGEHSRDDAHAVAPICFIGVTDSLNPTGETPEQVTDALVAAARYIPQEAARGYRRLRFLAVQHR